MNVYERELLWCILKEKLKVNVLNDHKRIYEFP